MNDAKFEKVKRTNGGRIYMLRFTSFEDKYFFWMQHPDETEDRVFMNKVNEYINTDLDKEGKFFVYFF